MRKKLFFLLSLLLGLGGPGWLYGEGPVVKPEGFVNAAALALDPTHGPVIVPGGLYTIFGEHLAQTTLAAEGLPLPTELAGVSVLVDGRPAPLLFVSPGQINLQAPFEIESEMPEVVVVTPEGQSEPIRVRRVNEAPGIFVQGGGGCGHGIIWNVAAEDSEHIN